MNLEGPRQKPPFNKDAIAKSASWGVIAGIGGSVVLGATIALNHHFTQPIPQSRLLDLFLLLPTVGGFLTTSYAVGKENYRRNQQQKESKKEALVSSLLTIGSGALLMTTKFAVDNLFNAAPPLSLTGIEAGIYSGILIGASAIVPYELGRKGGVKKVFYDDVLK